jgi:hypothetical protein
MIENRLQTLKWSLFSKGYEDDEVDDIIISARDEIMSQINDMVSSLVQEAVSKSSEMGAEEFMSQINLDSSNGYIEIITDSGKTDFSEPIKQMLPHLLEGGKTSSYGSVYKVVPIGKNPIKSQKTSMIKDIESGLSAMSNISKSGMSIQDATAEMAASFGMSARHRNISKPESDIGSQAQVVFRTASSNQDPNSSWVIPEKEADMTSIIAEINSRIRSGTDDIINSVMNKYERSY